MLLVDNVPLNMEDKTNPYVKEFFEWKDKFLRKHKFPLKINTNLRPMRNVSGDMEPPRYRFVPWQAQSSNNGVPVLWRYVDKPGNVRVKGETIGGSFMIQSTDMDKAFFYMEKCPLLKNQTMWIEDKVREAEHRLDARGQMVDVNWMLLSEASELSGDEDKVRELAMAIGFKKADSKELYSLPEIKDAILSRLEQGESVNDPMVNVATFLQMVGTPELMRRRSLVQKAEDIECILFDNNRFVVELHLDGEVRDFVKINPRDWERKEDVFIETLMNDSAKRTVLENVLGASFEKAALVNFNDVKNIPWYELKKKCESVGIPIVGEGRTKEVLQKALAEHLNLV